VVRRHPDSVVRLVKEHINDPRQGCEVGVWKGLTSRHFLQELPNLHLLMVDCYREFTVEEAPVTLGIDPPTQAETNKIMLLALATTQEFRDRRTLIISDSLEASKCIRDEFLDFVFIDAFHTYEAVRFDIQTWFPRVKTGGLVCGHDYGGWRGQRGATCGVNLAVDEFGKSRGYEIGIMPGRVWWLIK